MSRTAEGLKIMRLHITIQGVLIEHALLLYPINEDPRLFFSPSFCMYSFHAIFSRNKLKNCLPLLALFHVICNPPYLIDRRKWQKSEYETMCSLPPPICIQFRHP